DYYCNSYAGSNNWVF
nr:immunoglobulin light chain junction region [Macaca mulatta]